MQFTSTTPRWGSAQPAMEHQRRLGYTPAHQAALVVLRTKPFYMVGGAKGYPETEPWVDVEDAVTRIWLAGPTVVKRVIHTLELMQASVCGSWVHGTTRGSLQLPPGGVMVRRRAPLSAVHGGLRLTRGAGKGRRNKPTYIDSRIPVAQFNA